LIDIILAIIIGAICLFAATLFPSKEKIEKNDTAKYKSAKNFIFAAGFAAIIVGVVLILLFMVSEDYQKLINIVKMAILVAIGIVLISANIKKSKMIAAQESAQTVLQTTGVEVTAQIYPGPQPMTQQQIGVKAPAAAQPQVQAQKIGIKATPVPQSQVQAQQIGIKAQPAVQPQRQVIAPQPQPAPPQPAQPKIIVIKCPKCKGSMQINTAMLGQKMKCPHCGVEGRIG